MSKRLVPRLSGPQLGLLETGQQQRSVLGPPSGDESGPKGLSALPNPHVVVPLDGGCLGQVMISYYKQGPF